MSREHAKNVKRWRDGTMALRWCAAGMLEADHQFRRVDMAVQNGGDVCGLSAQAADRNPAPPVLASAYPRHGPPCGFWPGFSRVGQDVRVPALAFETRGAPGGGDL